MISVAITCSRQIGFCTVMSQKFKFLFLVSSILLHCVWGAGLSLCPSVEERWVVESIYFLNLKFQIHNSELWFIYTFFRNFFEGSAWIVVGAQPMTSLVRTLRMPQDGFYNSTLSCIAVSKVVVIPTLIMFY